MHHVTTTAATKRSWTIPKFPSIEFLKIFENPDNVHCVDSQDDDVSLTLQCTHLTRLCTASAYYDHLDRSNTLQDDEKKDHFVDFNEELYDSLLNDAEHLFKVHSTDIQRIKSEWAQYGLPQCMVSECTKMARHYSHGRRDYEIKCGNAVYLFYQSIYDRIHHFVSHLYDIGLRVDWETLKVAGSGGDANEGDLNGVTVDNVFAAEREYIKMRRQRNKVGIERFNDPGNKYTVHQIAGQPQKGAMTVIDAIFQRFTKIAEASLKMQRRVREYFESNNFDTDCIEMDLEDFQDSNLCPVIQNENIAKMMASFIESINCM